MAMVWTESQLNAIKSKNKTLLLSAAAGSGKTATLTERIIRSLTDPQGNADLSKMLIVTFTIASAADLRRKIYEALTNALANDPSNAKLSRQLVRLGSAKISTIDAFYLHTVRQHFSALGLSSSFRIADESETMLIANECISAVVNDFYDNDEDFPLLCECFEKLRDTEGVVENVLLRLYTECRRTPDSIGYLKKCAEDIRQAEGKELFDSSYGQVIKKHAMQMFSAYIAEYSDIMEKMPSDEHLYQAYYAGFESDRLVMLRAANLLSGKEDGGYEALYGLLSSYAFPNLLSIGKHSSEFSVYCKAVRDTLKVDFGNLCSSLFCYSAKDMRICSALTAKHLELLYRVLARFEKDYSDEKKRRNILELTDVKRLAYTLFVSEDKTPTPLARDYSQLFTDIYIDEYQDVDPVQDLIFKCISTPTNRFMVGDIKQSIYGFRGAMPKLFADYRQQFPLNGTKEAQDSSCETIFMSNNFRCDRPIIDFTNAVCADAFVACGSSIGYTKQDDLVYTKEDLTKDPQREVTVALFAKNAKKLMSKDIDPRTLPSPSEAEAEYIAKEIHSLIYTQKKHDGKPFRPKDVAVLFRSKRAAKKIAKALAALGIKTTNTEAVYYFQNPDVMLVLCILNAVDNPQRDVHLAGALRSPIFGFSLDELLLIKRYGTSAESLYDRLCLCAQEDSPLGEKCRAFSATLDNWRRISTSMPIDKFLSRLFSSEEFVASGLVCGKNALGEGGNLQRLYDYARTFEAGSFKGLYNFIEFINSLIESGETINASSGDASDDCVTLTTIHKSKGLEFPVCFVCDAAASFKNGVPETNLSFEYGTGVAMTLADSTGFAYYKSPLKEILDFNSDKKRVEEEIRLLYVALTRAKERLYVTGSYPKAVMPNILSAAEFRTKFKNGYSLLSANCYMDWVLPAIASDERAHKHKLLTFTTDALPDFSADMTEQEAVSGKVAPSAELLEKLKKDFSFKYPYSRLSHIPAKLSVSKLLPDILDAPDESVDLFDSEVKPSIPAFFLQSQKKATPAERGTATHLFLQFCDFHALSTEGVDKCLSTLTEKGFIPPAIASIVYREELEAFCHSELLREILSAKRVIREQRFNMLLPASDFTEDAEFKDLARGQSIAVQGVIDIILVADDGSVSLYDYKTDRLTSAQLEDAALASEKLNSAHALQLSYYASAVSYLFGKQPARVAVYSTHAARSYDITTKSLEIPRDIL